MAVNLPDDSFAEQLYPAIKNDDIKAFETCMTKFSCGALRMGRFPTLSVMYMYNARKLIKAYESKFLNSASWQPVKEPAALSADFLKIAGKCMRMYLDEVITPPEMLLLLGEDKKLKKIYPSIRPSAAVKERLKNIYRIKYSLELSCENGAIVAERRPLSSKEKSRIYIICAAAFVAAAAAVSVPFIVNDFKPYILNKDGTYHVSKASAIAFDSDKSYTLKNNIKIKDGFFAEKVTCNINGNGKRINFGGSSEAFGLLSGKLENVRIQTAGHSAFIHTVDIGANITGVEICAAANGEYDKSFAYLALYNYGTVEDVTLKVSGSIGARLNADQENAPDVVVGGIVMCNAYYTYFTTYYGNIKNCSAEYGNLTLTNADAATNATFGGIAGVNYGYIYRCKTSGNISADTFDLGGVCGDNYKCVSACQNTADLSQTTASESWNPLAAGIAITNYNLVEYCINYGDVKSESTAGEGARKTTVIAAGISGRNLLTVTTVNTVESPSALGTTMHCISEGEICAISGGADSYAGGITGYAAEKLFFEDSENKAYFGGCVTDCIFTGKVVAEGETIGGAITAVAGANIYENNLYYITGGFTSTEKHNFDNNCMAEGCGAEYATGATITIDDAGQSYLNGGNKGCTQESAEQIKSSKEYTAILSAVLGG